MKIKFLGAAKTVTGSKYLVTVDTNRYLIDCGLFQGNHDLRRRNWNPLPVNPKEIDSVLLTHAHIDHSGYLPLLVKNGFKGKIYATEASYELCKILLPDSAHLQEEEATFANKYHSSKHSPALPLYNVVEAYKTLNHFKVIPFAQDIVLNKHVHVTWHPAGHILGAAFLELRLHGQRIIFSGDLGRDNDPIMYPPKLPPNNIDYLIIESTYGNREHKKIDPQTELSKIINDTIANEGVIVIPAFAVGRIQSVLYYLYMLRNSKQIPDIPIYLDSPMGIYSTNLLCHFTHEHRLSPDICQNIANMVIYTPTPDESKEINRSKGSKIIISAGGMVNGGRVLHHIKYYAPDSKNAILLTGFQAPGTRGQIIESGHGNTKIFNEVIPVRAKIHSISNMSAHVDYIEMLHWLSHTNQAPKKTFITHGESFAAEALKRTIESKLNWNCIIPDYLDEYEIK